MTKVRTPWNRRPKRNLADTRDDIPLKADAEYKVTRVRPRSRNHKHQGYTIIPRQRLGVFENNEHNRGKHG